MATPGLTNMDSQPPNRQQNSNIYSPSAVKNINNFTIVKSGTASIEDEDAIARIKIILSHSLVATPISWTA